MAESEAAKDRPADSSAAQPTIALWKNRYLIEKELGRGGFGVVYLARDQQLLSKPVVIKVLQDETNPDPYFQKKFQQEIEALARIDHPGVVGVLDVGETPDGKPFLVMQYVEGVTLRSEIRKQGMELHRVAHIMRQVGQALGAAHDKGVYHRDLKPENIMLTRSSETEEYVKLIDFGIAAVRDSQVIAQSLPSKVVGTLSYMAPEQAIGKGSPTSDIYALGVIAFEMLTGQRPEVSWEGVAKKPRELRPDIPEAAQEVVLHALSYQPEKRITKPREFGDQVARGLGFEPTITSPLPAVQVPAPAQQPSSSTGLEMAYVLFMDIVSYSKLPMDLQSQRIQQLQQIVRSTAEYQRAQQADQIVSLPTGDGMALVFFQNPTAPVECATAISRSLKSHPQIQLRMGVHTGPVYRIADINTNRNVAGGGINLAQRVMDCGDSGHILLSKTVADILGQLSDWEPHLHDLGEAEVKHGVKVNVVNFYTSEVGNPQLPEKLRASREVAAALPAPVASAPTPALPQAVQQTVAQPAPPAVSQATPQPVAQYAAAPAKSNKGVLVAVGIVVVVVVGSVAAFLFRSSGGAPSPATPETPPAQSSVGVSGGAPGMLPPSGPPTANPPAESGPAPEPGPPPQPAQAAVATSPAAAPPASQQEQPLTIPGRPGATRALKLRDAPAESIQPTESQPAQSAAAPSAPALPEGPSAAELAALQESRERLILIAARAAAVGRSIRTMEQRQASQGVGMRGDMAAARDSMEFLLGEAKEALDARDLVAAKRNMDLAERALEKLENFLGRR
ncbi:MAG: protein kinase [Acidobacteria bacterium]|nr:protein kinase [Acidobacteriota bacterium]